MSITLTSTTSPMEEVQSALNEYGFSSKEAETTITDGTEPIAEEKKPEQSESVAPAGQKLEAEEDETAEDSETTEDNQEQNPDKPKGKGEGGFQRKINKLTAEKHAKDAIIADLNRKLEAKASVAAVEEPVKVAEEPKKPLMPKAGDFPTWEEYETALSQFTENLAEWKSDQQISKKLAEIAQQQEKEKTESANREALAAHVERINAAKKIHPDFDEVTASAEADEISITAEMQSVIFESELGGELAYWLGKNPEECERIANLKPIHAVRELGKIEERLSVESKAEKKPEKTPEPPKPNVSKAPTPIAPLGTKAAPSTKTPTTLKEWEAHRRAGGGK